MLKTGQEVRTAQSVGRNRSIFFPRTPLFKIRVVGLHPLNQLVRPCFLSIYKFFDPVFLKPFLLMGGKEKYAVTAQHPVSGFWVVSRKLSLFLCRKFPVVPHKSSDIVYRRGLHPRKKLYLNIVKPVVLDIKQQKTYVNSLGALKPRQNQRQRFPL